MRLTENVVGLGWVSRIFKQSPWNLLFLQVQLVLLEVEPNILGDGLEVELIPFEKVKSFIDCILLHKLVAAALYVVSCDEDVR